MEETPKNIYQRISAVMAEVSYVQKEDKKVNNQYTFVSHDAVTAKLRPFLIKHGIVVVPTVTRYEQDGNRTEATVQVSFVNIDNPEDRVTVDYVGYGIDPQDKGPGKAFSYASKYAFLKVFCLETGDDPERESIDHVPGDRRKKSNGAQKAPEPPTPAHDPHTGEVDPRNAMWKKVVDLYKTLGRDLKFLQSHLAAMLNRGISSRDEVSDAELASIVKTLEAEVVARTP